jgi:hypothetical protein
MPCLAAGIVYWCYDTHVEEASQQSAEGALYRKMKVPLAAERCGLPWPEPRASFQFSEMPSPQGSRYPSSPGGGIRLLYEGLRIKLKVENRDRGWLPKVFPLIL